MSEFQLVSDFQMTGDQPQAVDKLVDGLQKGYHKQTLLGVTGSGKTFTWRMSSRGCKGRRW